MAGFLVAVDIANRGLQHCGASRIDPTLGFAEDSKNASECGFVYDKLRQAELRRNVWRFAIKTAVLRAIDANTMLLTPTLWNSTTTFFKGSVVADENGQLWTSASPDNLNNQPGVSSLWQEYFGPLAVALYTSTLAYAAGELVYTTSGDGKSRVYLSLESDNSDNPATATAWGATAVYRKNQVVTYLSVAYMSLIDLNTNQVPSATPQLWGAGTTYAIGNQVGASDGLIYTSVINGNIGNDPVLADVTKWTTAGVLNPWTRVFIGGTGSLKWLQIGGAEFPLGVGAVPLNFVYPLGTGPSTQTSTRNVFRLPANYLRQTSADPKAGSASILGAPTNSLYNDWVFQGDYIVSAQSDPIVLAFVADTVDVRTFDPMFCEGLAARLGMEVCEPLTQSSEKVHTIAGMYALMMGEARTVNAIETGSEEAPLDDYVSVRY